MSESGIDKELAVALQGARKKPQNFAIVAKGSNCVKLFVSKKTLKEKELNEAKKKYQATTIIRGVVRGDGSDLVFQVLELPSLQDAKVRTFIKDESGLVVKARFEVVTALPEVSEQDLEGSQVESEQTTPPGQTESAPAPTDEGGKQKLLQAFKSLTPKVQEAIAAKPARRGDVLAAVTELKALLDKDQLPAANEAFERLSALLQELLGGGPGPAPGPTTGLAMLDAIKLVAANNVWKQTRDQALNGMRQLESALRATNEELGEAVADVIVDLAAKFPRTLDSTLDQLAQAARKGDAESAKPLQAAGQQGIKDCLAYLKEHAEKFSACEENEFGVGIKIHAPLKDALRDLLVIIK